VKGNIKSSLSRRFLSFTVGRRGKDHAIAQKRLVVVRIMSVIKLRNRLLSQVQFICSFGEDLLLVVCHFKSEVL